MHDVLFQPLKMGAIEAKNRIFMAPLTRGRAADPMFTPNELMETYYSQRSGAGMILTERQASASKGLAGHQRQVSGAMNRSRHGSPSQKQFMMQAA